MALSDGLATQTTDFGPRPRRGWALSRRLPGLIGNLLRTPAGLAQHPALRVTTSHAHELDCLRGVLNLDILDAAERRSREVGIGADQVLIRWGEIEEDA